MLEKPDARQRALSLCNLTPSQEHMIRVWTQEKYEKLRHWERKSGDPSIYVEYLNGCAYLDGIIKDEIDKINNREQAKQKAKQNAKGRH